MRKNIFSLSVLLSLLLFSSSVFAQTDLTGATVTLNPTSFDYDGTAHEPTVSGIRLGTKRYNNLVAGVDYDITYTDNVNAGDATATLTFKGDYTGVATKTFKIDACDLKGKVTLELDVDEVVYDGTEKTPAASDIYYEEKLLVPGTDYDLTYKNNTNPGDATATATFKGNYTGTVSANFTIIDGGQVAPLSLTVNYYDPSQATPQVVEEKSYDEFLTLRSSFPNAIAIAPQGFNVWPLDKAHIVVKGSGAGKPNICNSFTLTDKKDFWSSLAFTVKSFSYTRYLVEGYNTCCLPFAVGETDVPEGSVIYGFNNAFESYGLIRFKPISSADAGCPFLLKTQIEDKWEVTLSDIRIENQITNELYYYWTIDPDYYGGGMYGTYTLTSEYKYAEDNQYYGLRNSDNMFAPLANTLSPFRACVKGSGNSSSARSAYSIVVGDGITEVDKVESQESALPLSGKFVKNGNIVIFKKGLQFNAAGAQIK